MAINLNFQ